MVGRFNIMEARELTTNDVFTSGMVALTNAVDHGELLMEHVYPADAQVLPLMKQTLVTGLELKLERTHDLSAVIHADRLPDGRMLITTMPLIYGTYTVTRGTGTFTLEPPLDLNLDAGWPLFKASMRHAAETRFAKLHETAGANRQTAVAGLAPTPAPPAANELIRVEQALPMETPKVAVAPPPPPPAPTTPGKGARRWRKPEDLPTPFPRQVQRLRWWPRKKQLRLHLLFRRPRQTNLRPRRRPRGRGRPLPPSRQLRQPLLRSRHLPLSRRSL